MKRTFLVLALLLTTVAGFSQNEAPAVKKVDLGKNVVLELEGPNGDQQKRRVLIKASVCLRKGTLEQLLTRKGTKEHEAILKADIDARDVHTALTIARAEAGSPVKFQPKFTPPSGTVIKVTLEYVDKGKLVRVPGQEWIRNLKTKKTLEFEWVFAGSFFHKLPPDNKLTYAANDGDVICIANFDTAMLDLPIVSSKENEDLAFEANTDRIPELETPVLVILEPVRPAKKD